MPSDRFFIDAPLLEGQTLLFTGPEAHHMHVMRLSVEERIELINGKGTLATGLITSLEKRSVQAEVIALHQEPPPENRFILCQAIPKAPKLDWILEKGTELGVDLFYLFPSAHSEYALNPNKIERLHTITIAALKQSGRLFLPEIIPLASWEDFQGIKGDYFFGDSKGHSPPFANLCKILPSNDLLFFVGPERGFTEKEEGLLKNKLHAQGVRLNRHILRTETAAVAAISIYRALCLEG